MTWTGASNGNWNVAGNWNPAQVPGMGDTAVVPASTVAAVVYATTSVTLDCSGEVSVESGEYLYLTGTSYLKGGKLSGDGDVIIIVNDSNLLWSGGTIEGNGTFMVAENTQLVIGANNTKALIRPLVNDGWVRLNAGDLDLYGGSTGAGTFTVSNGASLDFVQGLYSIGRAVSNSVVNSGNMTMWNTSSVSFNAGYKQESTGTLALKVWGSRPNEYCKLNVGGTAELDGILKVDFINAYTPQPGDSFEIVTCGSRTGKFSSITSNMDGIAFEPTYADTKLTLTVKQVTAPTAPRNFTAAPGNAQVALSWMAPASEGGSAITKYQVSADNGVNWTDVGSNTSHTFTGLTNGTAYTFKVRAVNSAGNGAEASATATPTQYVCEIGTTKYATLDDALTAVQSGDTIKLLQSIGYTKTSGSFAITIDGKKITFDLSGNNLTIKNDEGYGVELKNQAKMTFTDSTGSGKLFIDTGSAGLGAVGRSTFESDSSVAVTIKSRCGPGFSADHATVNIQNGSVSVWQGGSYGVQVDTNCMITVNGPVTVKNHSGLNCPAVYLYGPGNTVNVGSAVVTGEAGDGVHIKAGGNVTVGSSASPGSVTGTNAGIYTMGHTARTHVTVYGDVEGVSYGICAFDNAEIKVYGDVTSTSTTEALACGIYTYADSGNHSSLIEIDGNVEGPNGMEVCGTSSTARVTGNVTANGSDPDVATGVYADDGTIQVGGNVVSSGSGAKAKLKGEVTIDGSLSAGTPFIVVGTTAKTPADITEPTTKIGFLTYSDGVNNVWIKSVGNPVVTAPTAPQNFIAAPGNGQVALTWTAPASNGGAAISVYEVSKDSGLTWVTASTNISHTFTGLTNGTAYTFKVRAVNSAGNGAEASATATPTAAPAPTYAVTVTNGTGGGEFAQGVTVTIRANSAPYGQRFKKWQVISGGITLVNSQEASTSFQMPANAVEVAATYEAIPGAAYTVTVNGSYAAASGAGNYAEGVIVTIDAGSRTNYSFNGWTSSDGVTFTNSNSATTTFTMPPRSVTVTANWSYNGSGGGSSGGGSSGGRSSTPTTPAVPAAPAYKADVKKGSGVETTIPVTVDKDAGTASVNIGSRNLDRSGTIITIPSIPDVDTYLVGIPVPDLSTSGVQGTLTVNTDAGSVTVPSNMLTGVSGVSGSKAEIAIGQGDKDNLPDAVKAAIGDRPLVQLTLSIDGKRTDWSNPDAPVTVSIPYTPTAAELANPESIVVWYIDGSGNAVSVPNGHYNPATGMVTFDTTHFSDYAVAYKKVSFKDVAESAWYSKAVGFTAAREITTGTGGGKFSPEAKLTRGQFIVMLMKSYGIAPDLNAKDNFADAGNTYYTGYLAAAKKLGISAGVGNNMFVPEKEITRQEMFTLLYNALKVIGKLPQGDTGKTLSNFSDANDLSIWAKEAMTLLVKTGTIGGNAGKLNPTSTTTRAEMAQVLYNLLSK